MAVPSIHGIRPPAPVNLDNNPADSWRLFRQKWQNYATITQLQKQPAEIKLRCFFTLSAMRHYCLHCTTIWSICQARRSLTVSFAQIVHHVASKSGVPTGALAVVWASIGNATTRWSTRFHECEPVNITFQYQFQSYNTYHSTQTIYILL